MKKVGILMGSDSDLPIVEKAIAVLKEYGVPHEVHVYSAHRTPVECAEFVRSAEAAGFGLKACIEKIHACGCLAGVSIKPFTMVSAIEDVLDDADMILIMTVEPGKGGQKMIPFTVEKVRELRRILNARGLTKIIEVDGGVNMETAHLVTQAGADMLVAGSAFFRAEDAGAFVEALRAMPTPAD